ncbi:MAG: hypothetical protein GSR79_03870 [Desulfurococcales archaeon]|nr:hypothetical protein [Desulfurococcales archaeon]
MKTAIVTLIIIFLIIGAIYYYNQGNGLSIIENVKEKITRTTSSAGGNSSIQTKTSIVHETITQSTSTPTTNTQTSSINEDSLQSIIEKIKRDSSKIDFSYTNSILSSNKLSVSLSWTYNGPVFYLDAWNDKSIGENIGFYDKDLNALYTVDINQLTETDILNEGNISSDMYTVYLLPDNVKPVDFKLINSGFNYGLMVLNESGGILLYPVDFSQYKIGPDGGYVHSVIFLKNEPFMEFYEATTVVKNYTLAHNAKWMDIQSACGIDDFRMEFFRLFYWNDTTFIVKSFSQRSISDVVEDNMDIKLFGEEKTYDLESTGLRIADVYGSLISSACSIIETKDSKLYITVPADYNAPISLNNTLVIGPVFEKYKSLAIKEQGYSLNEPFGIFALLNNNTIEFKRAFYYNITNGTLTYYSGTVKLDHLPPGDPVMIKFNIGPSVYTDTLLAVVDTKDNIYVYNISIVEVDRDGTLGPLGKLLFKLQTRKPPSRLSFAYDTIDYPENYTILKSISGGRIHVTIPEGSIYFLLAYNQFTSNGEQIVYNISYGIHPGS